MQTNPFLRERSCILRIKYGISKYEGVTHVPGKHQCYPLRSFTGKENDNKKLTWLKIWNPIEG